MCEDLRMLEQVEFLGWRDDALDNGSRGSWHHHWRTSFAVLDRVSDAETVIATDISVRGYLDVGKYGDDPHSK